MEAEATQLLRTLGVSEHKNAANLHSLCSLSLSLARSHSLGGHANLVVPTRVAALAGSCNWAGTLLTSLDADHDILGSLQLVLL